MNKLLIAIKFINQKYHFGLKTSKDIVEDISKILIDGQDPENFKFYDPHNPDPIDPNEIGDWWKRGGDFKNRE